MPLPRDIAVLRDFQDAISEDVPTIMQRLSESASDYEMLDREWTTSAGL